MYAIFWPLLGLVAFPTLAPAQKMDLDENGDLTGF
jgi:hypothetical protein